MVRSLVPSWIPALALAATAPTGPCQQVWTVDFTTGGADALQTTLQQAAPGDVLHVLPGEYTRAVVQRAQHLLAEPGARCHQLLVQGLPAGETVTVIGLDLIGVPGTTNASTDAPLRMTACAGDVFMAALAITGRRDTYATTLGFTAGAAVEIDGGRLHGQDLQIRGVDGGTSQITRTFSGGIDLRLLASGAAVHAAGAKLTLSNCTMTGGAGGSTSSLFFPCQYLIGNPGRPAVTATDALLVFDHCDVRGGDGGNGHTVVCQDVWSCGSFAPRMVAGPGAPGVTGSSTVAILTGASAVRAGHGGQSACGPPVPASALGDAQASAGSVTVDPAVTLLPEAGAPAIHPALSATLRALPSLTGATPRTRLGSPLSWHHTDVPGALVWWLLSDALAPDNASGLSILGGVDVVPVPWWTYGPWLVPASGQVDLGFTVPVDLALVYARLFVQTVALDPSGRAASTAVTAVGVAP